MSELQNDRFLRALLKQPVDTTPIWIMRQAGRYLPEYREDLDAAILFSDILTIPDAMGLGLYFAQGEGPKFERPLKTLADVEKIAIPDPEDELRYVMNAVRTIRKELNGRVPLIGFSGSPWTLATYMVEGGSTKDFGKVKGL